MPDAAKEAAAALAPAMLAELAEKIPLPPGQEDRLADDLAAAMGQGVVAQPAVVASTPQPAPAAPVADTDDGEDDEFVVPTFEPDLDDEYRELIEAPDFAAEAAAEVNARLEDDDNDDYTDPESAKQLLELQKRNQWLEQQVVRASRPKWIEEAKQRFPDLARFSPETLNGIDASSRRAFARKAAQANQEFARMAKPFLDQLAEARQQAAVEAKTDARVEAKAAWGVPTIGPPVNAVQLSEGDAALNTARKTKQLHKVINVMFKQAGIGEGR